MAKNPKGSRGVITLLIAFLAVLLIYGFMKPGSARAASYAVTTTTAHTAVGGATTTTAAPTTTTTAAPTTAAAVAAAPQKSGLAFTGADIATTMGAAAVALGLGGALVIVSRKRKGHHEQH